MLTTIQLGIVLAVVLPMGTLGVGASPAAAVLPESGQSASSLQPQSYEGVVTDTRCSAKHSAAIGDTAADCTIRCVRAGEQFVLVDSESSYVLEGDLAALKRAAGQRVKIVGTLNGGKISVSSITAP